eukprot:c8387_g1_i1.p1 GENE.c8387_g1_i1~~c8387_g1_i1.p1  ORF type:complete len:300 (+),score=63.48 c8387_g1_i1:35-901(+)
MLSEVLAWDAAITKKITRLSFPDPVEYLLSIPGCFFGMPVIQAFVPLYITALLHPSEFPSFLATWIFVLLVALWFAVQNSVLSWKFLVGPLFIPLHLSVIGYLEYFKPTITGPAFTFSFGCSIAVCIIVIIKRQARRNRPALVFKSELDYSKRAALFTKYIKVFAAAEGDMSFPSGDACVSACFATSLNYAYFHATGHSLSFVAWMLFCVCCPVLSCVGRVYFWAHHVLDAAFGAALGSVCVVVVWNIFGIKGPGAIACVFGTGIVLITYIFVALPHMQSRTAGSKEK